MSENRPMRIMTPRLVLRDPVEGDLPALQAIFSVAELHRYERPIPTPDEVRLMLQQSIECVSNVPRIRYRMMIDRRQTGELCGTISLSLNNSAIREWEIGWLVRREDWGKGIAPEAATAMVHYAFETLDAHRVIAFCHAENRQSMRVMEKIGMLNEALMRKTGWLNGKWYDECLYAILEDDARPEMR